MRFSFTLQLALVAGTAIASPLVALPAAAGNNVARAASPTPTASVTVNSGTPIPTAGTPTGTPIASATLNAAGTVTCRPTSSGNKKTISHPVATARASSEMTNIALGGKNDFSKGKSGDPHEYGNSDKLTFNVADCDSGKNQLYEYPIFDDKTKDKNKQRTWKKDTKTSGQAGNTPMRIVFAKVGDNAVYCGVMTHSVENSDGKGSAFFQICD